MMYFAAPHRRQNATARPVPHAIPSLPSSGTLLFKLNLSGGLVLTQADLQTSLGAGYTAQAAVRL